MRRVFHIISHFDVGGAERVAMNIARSGNTDIEYHVVEVIRARSKFTRTFIAEMEAAGIRYHRAFLPEVRFHFVFERLAAALFPFWFLFIFLRWRPDVIHTHTEVPDMAYYVFSSLFPWLSRRCRIVRTIHNTRLWTGQKKMGRVIERRYIRLRANIAISQSARDCYREVYGEAAPIIYNGVPAVLQSPYKGIIAGKTNILFAGRFEQQKGIDVLIAVIRRLQYDGSLHFHIVGDGILRPVIEKELGTLPNVTIRPPVYGLSRYLQSFDFLFMPSLFEGLGMLSIEASLVRLPVIASDCTGLNETLPSDWPLIAQATDAEGFVRIFRQVIPAADRVSLGEQAYRFVMRKFSIEHMRREYERIYLS